MGPVAGKAKKGAPNRKIEARYQQRVTDYDLMMSDKNDRTGRKFSGGYHKPGAFK